MKATSRHEKDRALAGHERRVRKKIFACEKKEDFSLIDFYREFLYKVRIGFKLNYKTKQQDLLLDFLKKSEQKHFTALEIADHLKEYGMGRATVYRQLEKLVDAGIVNKYFLGEMVPACFELVREGEHCQEDCFHCRCEKCGKLIHLHCDELKELSGHLEAEHGFEMNPFRTVFYGVCAECRAKDNK